MNKWKITYAQDPRDHYIFAMHIDEVFHLLPRQNWNQDNAYIVKIELVEYVTNPPKQ